MRPETEHPGRSSWWWRPLGVFGLLVVEYLYLALRFDGLMHCYPGPWQNLADLVTFATLGITGVLALAGRKTVAVFREELGQTTKLPRLRVPLTTQLVSTGCLIAWATWMTRGTWETGEFLWLVLGFVALAAVSLTSAILCLFKRSSLVRLGTDLRQPLIFGFACGIGAYVSGYLVTYLWASLSKTTIQLVAQTLIAVGAEVEVDYGDHLLFVEGFVVQVNRQCSGLEGMGLFALFLGIYLWADRARLRFPRALVVLPLGILAMYVGNLGRIVLLMLVGARISAAIAMGGFHSKAGWVYFCGLAILLMFFLSRADFFLKQQKAEPPRTNIAEPTNPAAAFLLPLVTLMGTSLITGALSEGVFDLYYGARLGSTGVVVFIFRAKIGKLLQGMSPWGALSGIICFALWMWVSPAPAQLDSQHIATALNQLSPLGRWSWLVTRVAGAILIVPVAEELAFRGFLLRRCVAADFDAVAKTQVSWWGLFCSSVVFGLLHSAVAAAVLVGAVYALTMWRKGSLADAILAHAVTNALLSGYVLWKGQWGYW